MNTCLILILIHLRPPDAAGTFCPHGVSLGRVSAIAAFVATVLKVMRSLVIVCEPFGKIVSSNN
ncbi:hypothetical protein GS682_08650 [Nostoc sp. B(2019)]|nr:hypothetical protein [Nostoc sp. B(2019)]